MTDTSSAHGAMPAEDEDVLGDVKLTEGALPGEEGLVMSTVKDDPAAELAASKDDGAGDDEDLDSEDSLTFSNGVIEKIVAIAMRDVPGVIGMKGSWLNRVQDVLGASDARKGVECSI